MTWRWRCTSPAAPCPSRRRSTSSTSSTARRTSGDTSAYCWERGEIRARRIWGRSSILINSPPVHAVFSPCTMEPRRSWSGWAGKYARWEPGKTAEWGTSQTSNELKCLNEPRNYKAAGLKKIPSNAKRFFPMKYTWLKVWTSLQNSTSLLLYTGCTKSSANFLNFYKWLSCWAQAQEEHEL